jgi:hypothetical protein
MYIYKSEILYTKVKIFSDKASESDLVELDALINKRAQEGWELATYSFMATSSQVRAATLITFRKMK